MTDSAREAKRYALRLLRCRDRSERELHERLARKGFPPEAVLSAVEDLRRLGYVDDRRVAGQLRDLAFQSKNLGRQGARRLLLARGIPLPVVEETIGDDRDREVRNLRRLLDKRLRTVGKYVSPKDKKRLWDYLSRRGFEPDMIRKALETIAENEEGGEA